MLCNINSFIEYCSKHNKSILQFAVTNNNIKLLIDDAIIPFVQKYNVNIMNIKPQYDILRETKSEPLLLSTCRMSISQ